MIFMRKTEYYIALIPGKILADKINQIKKAVFASICKQKYLADPPHITLTTGGTENIEEVIAKISDAVSNIATREFRPTKLIEFKNDILTRQSTFVLAFSNSQSKALQKIQKKIIIATKDNKVPLESYEKVIFSKVEKNNLAQFSFPYVGANWIPHLTICSTKNNFSVTVKKIINQCGFKLNCRFGSIILYRLDNGVSSKIKSFKLQ